MEQTVMCTLSGATRVGKTSLLYRHDKGEFKEDLPQSIPKVVKDGVTYIDIKYNEDDYGTLQRIGSLAESQAVLILYKFLDKKSMEEVKAWSSEARSRSLGPVMIIVSLQNDEMIVDPTWYSSLFWEEDKKKMEKRYSFWKFKSILPLFKLASNPETPSKDGKCYLNSQPDEVLSLIFEYLYTPDLAQLSITCKKFNDFLKQPHIWNNRSKLLREESKMKKELKETFKDQIFSFETCSAKTGAGVDRVFNQVKLGYQYYLAQKEKEKKDKKSFLSF